MRLRAGMKPRSSIRSASSRTRTCTPERVSDRVSIRSSKPPGVATRMSTRAPASAAAARWEPRQTPRPSTAASPPRRRESYQRSGLPAPSSGSAQGRGRFAVPLVAKRRRGAGGLVVRTRRSCRCRFARCRIDRARRVPAEWPGSEWVWVPCSLLRRRRQGYTRRVQGRRNWAR